MMPPSKVVKVVGIMFLIIFKGWLLFVCLPDTVSMVNWYECWEHNLEVTVIAGFWFCLLEKVYL